MGASDPRPGQESLFDGDPPKETEGERAGKRLMAEIDEEVKKSAKKEEKKKKPCLADVGLPTKEDIEAAGTEWEDDGEWGSSESEGVPAIGFWGTPAKAKKEKKKRRRKR